MERCVVLGSVRYSNEKINIVSQAVCVCVCVNGEYSGGQISSIQYVHFPLPFVVHLTPSLSTPHSVGIVAMLKC